VPDAHGTSSTITASTSHSSQPPTTSVDAKATITQVIKAYNAAYLHSLRDPANPPDLSTYAAGTALKTAQQDPARFAAQHLALRARANSQNRDAVYDVQVHGNKASATDCEVNDDLVVNSATGQVVTDKTQTNQSTYTLEFADGTWKITEIQGSSGPTSEGVSGCALSH
jgi:hypothetical protein